MCLDCKDSIEYSQWNNELIFSTLNFNPELFIIYLSGDRRKNTIIDFVLGELENPVNDAIKIAEIIEKLEVIKTKNENLKLQILESLNKAEKKYSN